MTERHPIWQALDGAQMDLRNAQAKLVSIRAQIAQLELPDAEMTTCQHCGSFPGGQLKLAEHIHVSHNGPIPDHWRNADQHAQQLVPSENAA